MEKLIKTLNNDLKSLALKLRYCKSKSMYYKLYIEISSMFELFDTLDMTDAVLDINDYTTAKLYEIDYNKQDKQFCNHIKNNLDFYKTLASNGTKLINRYNIPRNYSYEDLLSKHVNEKESINLALDFYDIYDEKIANLLYSLIKNNRVVTISSITDCGITYNFNFIENPFILLYPYNNLIYPTTLVHETAHCNVNMDLKNINDKYMYSNYREVFPYFIELLFFDYLEKYKIYNKDAKFLKKNFDVKMVNNLEYFYNIIKKSDEFKYLNNNLDNIYSILTDLLGFIIAYHFYEMFLEYPEKTKWNINNFNYNMCQEEGLYMITKYGLKKEEILSSKVLEKNIKKHL